MLSKTIEEALNRQINRELYSAYLYLAMSAYFGTATMKGFAKWMRIQAKEEQAHAIKFYDYVIARGGKVNLIAIEAPKAKWTSAGKIVELAIKEKDHATFEMLQWFVKEQVEEEDHASEILGKIKSIGDIPGHLFCLDHELGKRQ
jgi:ferritin